MVINRPGKRRTKLLAGIRDTAPAEPQQEPAWQAPSNIRPQEIPDVAPQWSGASETDVIAGAAEKINRRKRIIDQVGIRLDAWLAFYVAARGPLDGSTLAGWRLSLRWLDAFCKRPAVLDDLAFIGLAESSWLARGSNPGTVKTAIAKLLALERFAAECGAVDLPDGRRRHWRIRAKPGSATGRRVRTSNRLPRL